MHPNVRTFLDLSTDHLKLSTRHWMDGRAYETTQNPAGCSRWIAGTPYGFFLYVDTDAAENHKAVKAGTMEPDPEDEPDFPADLLDCMVYAHDLGVGYIMFDQDADAIDDLPRYGDGEEALPPEDGSEATTPAADPAAPAGAIPERERTPAEVREACARVVEENQQQQSADGRGLAPRFDGNLDGLAYADAIRAVPLTVPA